MSEKLMCGDFFGFQEALRQMRDMDDKIITTLNTSFPTESFKGQLDSEQTCNELYTKLLTGHRKREDAIKNCIQISSDILKEYQSQQKLAPNNIQISKNIKTEHRKLRSLQSELNIEEIIKARSLKAVNERCRSLIFT